jgi:biofilm PGA synthesis protein PgaA
MLPLFAAMIASLAAPAMVHGKPTAKRSTDPFIIKIAADDGHTIHAKAQQAVRDDRLKDALALLTKLRLDYPNNSAYLFDYVAVSSWSGEHAQALREGEVLLQRADTPIYALEALGFSARETKRLPLALAAYDAVLAREPARIESRVGRARVLLEDGDVKKARQELLSLQQSAPERIDVEELLARSYEAESEWISLLTVTQNILRRAPQSEAALRMRFHALLRLGAPHLALAITPSAAVAPDDRIAAERDRIALDLRWARVVTDQERGAKRWLPTDAAIADAERTAKSLAATGNSADARRQQFDLLVGLVDRQRSREAIALYEELARPGEPLPAYVRLTAAAAYLREERPDIARDLFAGALAEDSRNLNAKFGYFYSLLESERYDDAVAFIRRLAASTPEWRDAAIPQLRRENPDYPLAQTRAALAYSYTSRLKPAQQELEDLKLRAPANFDIRNSLNTTYHLRGWPRRAEIDYRWMLAAEPDYWWAYIGLFDDHLAIQDYRMAEADLAVAVASIPEEKATSKRQRAWETHNLRELRVETRFGRSEGGSPVSAPTAARDYALDTYLYSSPLAYNWRVFTHLHASAGVFSNITATREAAGVGAEYRARDWLVSAELRTLNRTGAAVGATATHFFDDHWSVQAEAETNSLSTPLRAHADGIAASRLGLGIGYRWHESCALGMTASAMDFEDGNRRNTWTAAWTRRMVTGPIYKLDARFDLYASSNSLPAVLANYFNPSRDRALSLTLENEWLHFRRYEHSLSHRLLLTVGSYWQEGFGAGDLRAVRYEQAYAPHDRLSLLAGVSKTWRPFDGARVSLDNVYLTADWRF